MARIAFINKNQALSGRLGEFSLPREYVWTAKVFRCGAIDRTETLDLGFDYRVIDPIPAPANDATTFDQLCEHAAENIVSEALARSCKIRVFWSGGIDSTVALIALMKAVTIRDCAKLLDVLISTESVEEYPHFFDRHIRGKYGATPITPPVSQYLDPQMLNVTGEMGDQLFGSCLSREFVDSGIAHLPYRDVLPLVLTNQLGNSKAADRLLNYLQPQVDRCPVLLETLFDYYWWINFSLKWQQVAFRLQVFREKQIREVDGVTRHFFRGPAFQNWSLSHPAVRAAVPHWRKYKLVAKQYIYEFTKDDDYRTQKTKEPSLKSVMFECERRESQKTFVYMDENYQTKFRRVNRGERKGSHPARLG